MSKKLRATVCQLNQKMENFETEWKALVKHAKQEKSDLVLLPEMPFSHWVAVDEKFDSDVWDAAVKSHETWTERISELAPATVIATRPMDGPDRRVNDGFSWSPKLGIQSHHQKVYLPNDFPTFEANWYRSGPKSFEPFMAAGALTGMMICSELWYFEHARDYGKQKAEIIVTPRKTAKESVPRWLAAGQAAAVVAGAYSLSSNTYSDDDDRTEFGGASWIISPSGEILAQTNDKTSMITIEIDLEVARAAKKTYPRNIVVQ
jgi:N-carbamoylputrescine amidase